MKKYSQKNYLSNLLIFLPALCLFYLAPRLSFANEFPAKARVFIGAVSSNPTELNTELKAQNFKDLKSITKYGTDITYSLNSILDVGFRYERISQNGSEITATANQSYTTNLTQDAVLGIARSRFYKDHGLLGDVFLGAGVSTTKFTIKNASQNGSLETSSYSTPIAEAGLTFGAGINNIYLIVEAGYELNKVTTLKSADTINGNVKTIDLSGGFVTVGLFFDGIKATSK